jgi:thiamine biosynthesis lipoprotein
VTQPAACASFQRRARPALGTLVEVGVPQGTAESALALAFAAVAGVERVLSRHDAGSDLGRCHAAAPATPIAVSPATQRVLRAAAALWRASQGAFDISLGSGPAHWHCQGGHLWRDHAGLQLDAGGIAKGHAVDLAVRALQQAGCTAGWVNAGGDLRSFGGVSVPVHLRDEQAGGVRLFGHLADGAMATSDFGPRARSRLSGPAKVAHVSVLAPRCLWADALTKLVAATGRTDHPVLARLGATAWVH